MDETRCGPLLVCQKTGGGKSTVTQLGGVVLSGIMLVITPTLSLNADQVGKLRQFQQRETYVFNLDEHSHSHQAMQNVMNSIRRLVADRHDMRRRAVYVFVSPMLATDTEKPLYNFFKKLAWKRGIGAIVLDELQMLLRHSSFRLEVRMLKEFIQKLKSASRHKNLRIVALCATMAREDEVRVQRVFGITFEKMVCATPREMSRRQIRIELVIREPAQAVAYIKPVLRNVVESSDDHNAVIFTQTKKRVENIADSISNFVVKEAKEADSRRKEQLVLDDDEAARQQTSRDKENIDPRAGRLQGHTTSSKDDSCAMIPSTCDIVRKWGVMTLTGDSRPAAKSFTIDMP